MKLRVLTLNVWNDQGDSHRYELINREIRRLQPDLVAFQEVSAKDGAAQLGTLLEDTGLQGTHQSEVMTNQSPWTEQFGGTALASRFPYRVVEVLDPRTGDAMDVPWATLAAVVTHPEGEFLFIATTGAWRLGAELTRERHAVALTELDARHRKTLPTIIAGDFNAPPEAASIRFLKGQQSLAGRSVFYQDAWTAAGKGEGHTWTAQSPTAKAEIAKIGGAANLARRIDYIFVGGKDAHPKAQSRVDTAQLVFSEPVESVRLSDHFGVLADLEISVFPSE